MGTSQKIILNTYKEDSKKKLQSIFKYIFFFLSNIKEICLYVLNILLLCLKMII